MLEVENYLIVEPDETVIVSGADVMHGRFNQLEGLAKLGDFQLRIIEGEWGNVDGPTLLKGPLAPATNGLLQAKKGRKTLRLDD